MIYFYTIAWYSTQRRNYCVNFFNCLLNPALPTSEFLTTLEYVVWSLENNYWSLGWVVGVLEKEVNLLLDI